MSSAIFFDAQCLFTAWHGKKLESIILESARFNSLRKYLSALFLLYTPKNTPKKIYDIFRESSYEFYKKWNFEINLIGN